MKFKRFLKPGIFALVVLTFTAFSLVKPSAKTEPELPGIKFFHGTLAKAKAQAKKENKLIFIDCYTTWCGPCKNMAKKTFVDKAVGEYFNKNFICLKMDMEDGEGPDFASKYSIEAYPTYIFMDHTGAVKHRELGYIEATRFIEVGKVAASKK
jgi:thiol-disulfide isomerase/thioredoxin